MEQKEANLICRLGDGSFELTAYGENALNLLPGFKILSKHTKYFTTHTLSRLPHEFLCRIGDLVECTYIGDVMLTFYEAEEFLWLLSDQHLVSTIPHIKNALENNVKVKTILPSDLPFPKGYFEQESVKESLSVSKKARRDGRLE